MIVATIITTIIASLVALRAWRFLNWVWLKPRKIERLFRRQGMKGNPYKLFFGDSRDSARMYHEAFSKPIGIHDDITPRVMPNIYRAVQQHGSFCFVWTGPRPRVFIMDPNIARDVLSKHQVYLKPFVTHNETSKMLTTGVAFLEGEEWNRSRSRINPIYRLSRLWAMVPMIKLCCDSTMKELKDLVALEGGSAVVNVMPAMESITTEILARLIFNCPYTDEIKETFRGLGELADLANLHVRMWSLPGEKYIPTKTSRRAHEIDKYTRKVFTAMINERLKKRKPEDEGSEYEDLLDVFMHDLNQRNFLIKDRKMVMEETIAELRGHFFAGFETTSNNLTWTLIMLSCHQNCQDRARAEVLQVLGNKDKITSDDVSKLKYIEMVVHESLRLFPPPMELTRLVNEDVIINGYKIPKDTLLTFPILMYNRSAKYWGEDVGEFKPERFSEGKVNASNGESVFMPFGWGPRICIGMNLSVLESKIALALLLREFSFELSPAYVHAPYVTITIQPQFGAPLVLKKL